MEVAVPKVGITNLKIIIVSVAALGSVAGSVLADGKIGVSDVVHIVKLTSTLGNLAQLDVKAVVPEINDLDKEEMHELSLVFDQNFKLGEFPTLEAKIEAGLSATIKALEAVQFLIGLVKTV